MRGLFSRAPARWAVRLMAGGELLLLVLVVLILASPTTLGGSLIAVAVAISLVSAAALLFAILGERTIKGDRHAR